MPNSYYIEPADVVGRFRQGAGEARVGQGRYADAARIDPANANSYMALEDRATARQDRQEQRAFGRSYADAYNRGDYAGAGDIAARHGSIEGVQGARTARTEQDRQNDMRAWGALRGYQNRLEALRDNPNAEAEWGAMLDEAIAGSASNPDLQAQIQRFPRDWATAQRVVPSVVAEWMGRLERHLDPSDIAEMQRRREDREYNQRRDLTPEEISARGLRPGTFAQTDASGRVYVEQNPLAPNATGEGYRPVTVEEADMWGLPNGGRGYMMANGRPTRIAGAGTYTDAAANSAQYASRMAAADQTMVRLENSFTDPSGVFLAQSGMGSQYERQVRQAQREFVNAILRRESGAVISDSEFASAAQQYFPQPGDGPAVIQQKRAARQRALQGLINASQGAYNEWYGEGSGAEAPPPPPPPGSIAGAIAGQSTNIADLERPREIPADEWGAMTPEERNRTIQILGRRPVE